MKKDFSAAFPSSVCWFSGTSSSQPMSFKLSKWISSPSNCCSSRSLWGLLVAKTSWRLNWEKLLTKHPCILLFFLLLKESNLQKPVNDQCGNHWSDLRRFKISTGSAYRRGFTARWPPNLKPAEKMGKGQSGLKSFSRLLNRIEIGERPCSQVFDVRKQAKPQVGQPIFHTWGNFRVGLSGNQTIRFQGTQGHRQHFLWNVANRSIQILKTHHFAFAQDHQH